MDIVFPEAPHEPNSDVSSIILFGKEKCGKTTSLSKLKNCLIIDTEYGSLNVPALSITPPEDNGPVGKMNWLRRVGNKLIEDGRKYDYVAIDTLSEVNDWAEWSGTFKYMNSLQGSSFNRVRDAKGVPIKNGPFLEFTDINYQSVHSIPEGYGYRWSRDEVMDIFNLFKNAAKKCVIFVCHVEDKYIPTKDNTEMVMPRQLALTGALRNILPRKVGAIGYVYNDKGVVKVNFAGTDDKLGGARAQHLIGYNDVLDWSKIFID